MSDFESKISYGMYKRSYRSMESYAMRYGLVLKITVTGIFFKKVTVYVTGSKKGIAIFKGAFGL